MRNTQWVAVEASIWLNNDVKAQNRYARALEYFEQAEALRGCAAVHLRRGCIEHADALKATIKSSEWHDITSGRAQDLVSGARLVGLSAVQNGNSIMAQFCSLLMINFGQRQWLDYSRSKIASWSYYVRLDVLNHSRTKT